MSKKTTTITTTTSSTSHRRSLLKGVLGISAAAVVLPNRWTKPVVNAVLLPVHAQSSPVPECPAIVIGNVTFGPQSGTPAVPVCVVSFDVLSSDPAIPLTITAITNGDLGDDVTITYDSFGEATDTTGPRVIWAGPASDAPFCSDNTPIDDVTFTVTATCAVTDSVEIMQDFTLAEILA